jgi:pimeloyl-ACP methyl ester carboxylesterase
LTGAWDGSSGLHTTLDQRMDDIIAVLDAVGSSRAALVALAVASMLTTTFAASYPERTQALVLHEPHARGSYATDYPWSATLEQTPQHRQAIERGWGSVAYDARTSPHPAARSSRRHRSTGTLGRTHPARCGTGPVRSRGGRARGAVLGLLGLLGLLGVGTARCWDCWMLGCGGVRGMAAGCG